MKLRWDRRAVDDLRDIRSYIATANSPAAARRVRRHLQHYTIRRDEIVILHIRHTARHTPDDLGP